MGKTRIAISGILLFAAALMILSCASPMHLTDNWRNSTYTGPAYKKIMVVAMTKRDYLRQPIENEFAKQLKSQGVEAATCHDSFPDPDKATREELIRVSQGMGIEASDGQAARSGNPGVEALRRENDGHRLAIHRRCRQPLRERRPDLPLRQPGGEDPWR
jgi:hypothetical protein